MNKKVILYNMEADQIFCYSLSSYFVSNPVFKMNMFSAYRQCEVKNGEHLLNAFIA